MNSIKGWTVISHGTVKGQRRQAKKEMKLTCIFIQVWKTLLEAKHREREDQADREETGRHQE